MSRFSININKNDLVSITKKLESGRKVDLPIVVRQTLNSVVFAVKKKTLIDSYNNSFKNRSKGFLKWSSRAEAAKGLTVNKMVASVGILDKKRMATKNLAIQEYGGVTKDKIYELKNARTGGDWNRGVAKKHKLTDKKTWNQRRVPKGNVHKFIKQSIKSIKNGQNLVNWGGTVYEVEKGDSRAKPLKFKSMYKYNDGKYHKANRQLFMMKAFNPEVRRANEYFEKHALKRLYK